MKTRMTLFVTMTVFLISLAVGAFAQDMPGAGDGAGPLHENPIMAGPGEPMGGPQGGFEPPDDFEPGQQAGPRPPGGPHGGRGLLFCNRHLYYAGDELSVTVCLPVEVQDLISDGPTELHLLVFSGGLFVGSFDLADFILPFPDGEPCQEIVYSDVTDDMPPTEFQLALVLVDGDSATNVGDWYDGLRGLLGVCGMRLNPGNAPEDANRDGFMDGNQAGIGGTVFP